jgi:hypothetical protein
MPGSIWELNSLISAGSRRDRHPFRREGHGEYTARPLLACLHADHTYLPFQWWNLARYPNGVFTRQFLSSLREVTSCTADDRLCAGHTYSLLPVSSARPSVSASQVQHRPGEGHQRSERVSVATFPWTWEKLRADLPVPAFSYIQLQLIARWDRGINDLTLCQFDSAAEAFETLYTGSNWSKATYL